MKFQLEHIHFQVFLKSYLLFIYSIIYSVISDILFLLIIYCNFTENQVQNLGTSTHTQFELPVKSMQQLEELEMDIVQPNKHLSLVIIFNV